MKIFDWKYYLENNEDLKDNDILTQDDAIKHWEMFGINENRDHRFIDDFNLETYFKKIIELEENKILNKEDSWTILKNIYINSSSNLEENKKEIDIENFDWKYYIDNNTDLKKSGILTELQAKKHWEECGKTENRKHRELINKNISNITYENFDWLFYISNNIDLFDNNILKRDDLWEHWNNFGVFEERKINILNTQVKEIVVEKYNIDDYIKNENKYDFDNYVSTEEKYNLTINNTKIVDVPISKNISTKNIKNNIKNIDDYNDNKNREMSNSHILKNTKIIDIPAKIIKNNNIKCIDDCDEVIDDASDDASEDACEDECEDASEDDNCDDDRNKESSTSHISKNIDVRKSNKKEDNNIKESFENVEINMNKI